MALVELVHPRGSRQVSVVPLIMKCDLFKNNPGLTISLYRVQSGVSLEDFQDFVSALEDKPININDRSFPGLSQLSEEFGFQSLLKKLSSHRRSPGLSSAQTAECLSRISVLEELAVEGTPPDEFTFTINDKVLSTSYVEAVLLSPVVGEQLQVYACARRFGLCAPGIDFTDFSSLQSLLSGKEVLFQKSHQKSLIRLSRQLLNIGLRDFSMVYGTIRPPLTLL
jgi:hypothetical protein